MSYIPIQEGVYQITDLVAISGIYTIDLEGNAIQKAQVPADLTLSVSGLSIEEARSVALYFTASGTTVNFTFDSDWKWLGTVPTSLADGVTGLLHVQNIGSALTDVVATYGELA